jgi:hypothetical protein
MNALTTGTLAGTGSFRCESCGYVVTMSATERIGPCPSCGERRFSRASLFAAGGFQRAAADADVTDLRSEVLLRASGEKPCLAFREGDETRVIELEGAHLRVGRSLSAEIRFDDSTVSRRHALLVIGEDGSVRVLDDRSLNGVFVNGERVVAHTLADGDELTIGRYKITFVAADSRSALPRARARAANAL